MRQSLLKINDFREICRRRYKAWCLQRKLQCVMSETPIEKIKLYVSYEDSLLEMKRRVSECGIFYEGKLKGQNISGVYKTYEITDMDALVSDLAHVLRLWELEPHKQVLNQGRVIGAFGRISKELNDEVRRWSEMAGVNPKKYLRRIRTALADWQERILYRLITNQPVLSSGSLADALAIILRNHCPTAPDSTITKRVSDLLKLLDIEKAPETIRKRIFRRATT